MNFVNDTYRSQTSMKLDLQELNEQNFKRNANLSSNNNRDLAGEESDELISQINLMNSMRSSRLQLEGGDRGRIS